MDISNSNIIDIDKYYSKPIMYEIAMLFNQSMHDELLCEQIKFLDMGWVNPKRIELQLHKISNVKQFV